MIPYADLMSNLVILFLALFAASYNDEVAKILERLGEHFEEQQAPPPAPEDLQPVQDEIERLRLSQFGVQVTASRLKISLPEPVLFGPGSAELRPGAAGTLDQLEGLLKSLPSPVLVEGHTDSVPVGRSRWRNNWELSAARAFAVAEHFARKGLPPARFHARGFAEFQPRCPANDTRECRRANRRIEISLIRDLRKQG